jgi:uncharacterized protein (TIGR02265 family)
VSDKLFFQAAVESLFSRGLGAQLTPALKGELRGIGIDLDKLLPGYELSTVIRGVELVVKHLPHPEGPAAARRQLGRRFMQGYKETLIGRAMVALMGLLPPERSLARMERNFRTGSNYMHTKFELLGPGVGQLWLSDVEGMAEVWEGILLEGAELSNAPSSQVSWVADERGPGATYTIKWVP